MDWTNELTFEFLRCYENEQALWNSSLPQHKNKNDIHDAWLRIKNSLADGTIPVTELKKKKENLMSTYRKVNGKIRDSMKTGRGTNDVYKPEWPFYNVMATFLDVVYKPRTTKTTVDSDLETPDTPETESVASPEALDSLSSFQFSRKRPLLTANTSWPKKRSQFSEAGMRVLQREPSPEDNNSLESQEITFGKNVGQQLQEVETRQKIIAQKLISDVLFHAKLGNLNDFSVISITSQVSTYPQEPPFAPTITVKMENQD